MAKLSPHEKKIWQQGFFCGLRTYKQRHCSDEVEPSIEFADHTVYDFITEEVIRINYKIRKLHHKRFLFAQRHKRDADLDLHRCRVILEFLTFCSSVGHYAFLDYLKDSTYFEQVLYSKGAENEN